MKGCIVCGKGDEDRPMCWRGERVCSEACRKAAEKKEEA